MSTAKTQKFVNYESKKVDCKPLVLNGLSGTGSLATSTRSARNIYGDAVHARQSAALREPFSKNRMSLHGNARYLLRRGRPRAR